MWFCELLLKYGTQPLQLIKFIKPQFSPKDSMSVI